jgi:hypothetical protein
MIRISTTNYADKRIGTTQTHYLLVQRITRINELVQLIIY